MRDPGLERANDFFISTRKSAHNLPALKSDGRALKHAIEGRKQNNRNEPDLEGGYSFLVSLEVWIEKSISLIFQTAGTLSAGRLTMMGLLVPDFTALT
jgi:hypothetical protein